MGNYHNYKNTDLESLNDTDAKSKSIVQINDFLFEKLTKFPKTVRYSAMKVVASNVDELKQTNDEPENVGFIVKDDKNCDVFMEMEYFNDGYEPFFIMDINEISADEYLDYLNLNKTINEIKHRENQ